MIELSVVQADKGVFLVFVTPEKGIKISRPTSGLELELLPIEVHKLADAVFSESNYLHFLSVLKLLLVLLFSS